MKKPAPANALTPLSRRQLLQLGAASALLACAPNTTSKLPDVPFSERSRFRRVYSNPQLRQQFFAFLSNVFHIVPEHPMHLAIAESAVELSDDKAIYMRLQERMPDVAPMLSSVRYALPALAHQKREIADETARLVKDRVRAERYIEIGTPGRYVRQLRERMHIGDDVLLVHTSEPSMGAEDIAERGQLSRIGAFTPLADYAPIDVSALGKGKADLVTNYIGLHHVPRERLEAFVNSIHEAMRPKGVFVLRDHDVVDGDRDVLVSLAHDVFNAGLGMPWSYNADELRYFQSIAAIESYLGQRGFVRFGPRIAQPGDPTHNLLVAFERV